MTKMTWIRPLGIFAVIVLPWACAEESQRCGSLTYLPSEYTCYNNTLLCPMTPGGGAAMGICGTSTCYDAGQYECSSTNGGTLVNRVAAKGPFVLSAQTPNPILNKQVVNVCGGYFAIGAGARQCASCQGIEQGRICSSYGNQTVLLPDGSMVS